MKFLVIPEFWMPILTFNKHVDERRMKVVEMGGAQKLLDMLEVAKDDKTRKYALKALVALSHSGKFFKMKFLMHLSFYARILSG